VDIVENPVHPMVQILFPNNDAIFQDDNSHTHCARSAQSWFDEHEDALQHLPWPAQLPDKYHQTIVVIFREYGEKQIPPPSSLKQLEDVLHEQRYNIPLETCQNLHESIPRRIQAVLQANVGPTPY
jgi:hypothetical protein